ncbi:hypothetical protein [Paenarthrobacter aromaticivorans]|uniref:hypothetical protein n=1 Tax=Paenarthrobacter aromaticivorans TaxID=2849150 RepID=UPI003A7F9D1D
MALNQTFKGPAVHSLFALIASGVLVGCSNPGALTCDEYAAQTFSERKKIEKSLLEAHNLETLDLDNMLGLQQALSKYCGVYSFQGSDKAGSNGSSSIDKAVKWSSKRW